MKKWKDKERGDVIVESEVMLGRFGLSIHRHISCDPEQWLATCYGLFSQKVLGSKDLNQAKCQAVAMVQEILEVALADILTETVQLTHRE